MTETKANIEADIVIPKIKEFIDSYRPLVPWLIALILAAALVVDKYDIKVVHSTDADGIKIVGISYKLNIHNRGHDGGVVPTPNTVPPQPKPDPDPDPILPPIPPSPPQPEPTPYDLRPDILKAVPNQTESSSGGLKPLPREKSVVRQETPPVPPQYDKLMKALDALEKKVDKIPIWN